MRKSAEERYAPLFSKNVASLREEDPHNPHDESKFITNTELYHDTHDSTFLYTRAVIS
jgi:hypothetical protein